MTPQRSDVLSLTTCSAARSLTVTPGLPVFNGRRTDQPGPQELSQARGRHQARSRSGRRNGVDVTQSHPTGDRMAVQGRDRVPDRARHQLAADLLQTLPGGGDHIVESLDAILHLARASCPSCVAVSLTFDHENHSVTIAASESTRQWHAPALTVKLPPPSTKGPARQPAVLTVFATDSAALTRLAADLTAVLRIDPSRITLAGPTPVPQAEAAEQVLSEQLGDRAAINRALGVLLDQGWAPTQGRSELQRRADNAGASLAHAAAGVLAALPGPAPQTPS